MKRLLVTPLLMVFSVGLAQKVRAEHPNDLLVITNKATATDQLSKPEIRSYFLKQRLHWGSGQRIHPINAKRGTELRRMFQARVLEMSPAEEAAYWRDQGIRKALAAPAEIGDVLKAVFRVRGAIGYVFRRDFKSGVAKVLATFPAQ